MILKLAYTILSLIILYYMLKFILKTGIKIVLILTTIILVAAILLANII